MHDPTPPSNDPSTATAAEGRRLPPRILVVDDEEGIRRLIQSVLERNGFQVETAENGIQAYHQLLQSRPDLLISDVMMPEMDGFELVEYVRRDPALVDLPVILLTAKSGERDIVGGHARGADMYLTKPFNPSELLAFARRLLNQE